MKGTYLIVGGSSGIGLQLVKILTEKGHDVYVASRDRSKLNGTAVSGFIEYDASIPDSSLSIDIEKLDGLVYCPGSINLKPFNRLKERDFENDFNINVMGAVRSIQSCLPLLKKSANASIVLFSTVAVSQGMPFHASVAAAKGAIEGLGRSLAAELAPSIRVNVIAPSITNTPLAERLLSTPEKESASAGRHPLKRVGTPNDIASAAAFLLSQDSGWMTGQVLGIDGGLSSIRSL